VPGRSGPGILFIGTDSNGSQGRYRLKLKPLRAGSMSDIETINMMTKVVLSFTAGGRGSGCESCLFDPYGGATMGRCFGGQIILRSFCASRLLNPPKRKVPCTSLFEIMGLPVLRRFGPFMLRLCFKHLDFCLCPALGCLSSFFCFLQLCLHARV
jgi:hypothetical protein